MCGSDPNLAVIDQGDLGTLMGLFGLNAPAAIRAKFTWDAENRLVAWEPLYTGDPNNPPDRVLFAYDYLGRRVQKRVETWDPNGHDRDFTSARRFVWYNISDAVRQCPAGNNG
jgi:hypothetical protein